MQVYRRNLDRLSLVHDSIRGFLPRAACSGVLGRGHDQTLPASMSLAPGARVLFRDWTLGCASERMGSGSPLDGGAGLNKLL